MSRDEECRDILVKLEKCRCSIERDIVLNELLALAHDVLSARLDTIANELYGDSPAVVN